MKSILAVLNPSAGGGRASERWLAFRAALKAAGMAVEEKISQGPGDIVQIARVYGPRFGVLVAVGGDGTANEMATGLLRSGAGGCVMAVAPCGTGNDVAQLTGIRDPEGLIRALREGSTCVWDAIEICYGANGGASDFALLFAAVGFAGDTLRKTTARVKRICGAGYAYSVGFFRALAAYRAPQMRVEWAEGAWTERIFHVSAGNTEVAGGGVMRLSPGANPSDGQLNLCVIPALSWVEAVRCFPLLLRGTHIRHPKVRYWTGDWIAIQSESPVQVLMDGDFGGWTPVRFEVRRGALRLVCARELGARG